MKPTGEIVPCDFRLTPGRLAALACTSVIVLTGCGSGDDDSETRKPTANAGLIPVTQACDGLFDEAIAKEARKPNGPSKVYPVKTDPTSHTAKALREEPARRGAPEHLCTLTDKADGAELLAITVAWVPHSPPSARSVHYTTTTGPQNAGSLLVTCDTDGGSGTESGGGRSLEFNMRDYFTLSDHSHAKLLIASAKKVTSQLDCREDPEYPNPKDVAPPPDPRLR
ncbi:hypothetical protein [Streptomyces malaysiensis]|uniref:DUF3558 domain-containing protein n=1 Tax=Streptomyces autolyticus TaxID=75293 RepID=A0ABN4VWN5_9ACTN|nr:hypothetical protein [Streptomyces autolyticus]AQA09488.1 hypothetical protein BV401_02280 [Streptomyces autolyticus]